MTAEQEALPVAYCPPGMRAVAELALLIGEERFSEVRESQFIETGIWLITPPDLSPPPPFAYEPPERPVSQAFFDRLLAERMLSLPRPMPLPVLTCIT